MLLRSRAAKERRTCGSCKELARLPTSGFAQPISCDLISKKSWKINTTVRWIPPKSWQKKNFPKDNLAQNFPTVTNHSKPKKKTTPYYPSDRAKDLLLPFRWCFTSARKLRRKQKNTSNRTKKSDTKSEAFQCPESNAIIDPGTMVIHLQNTGLTWATPEEWSWLPDFLTAKAPEHNPRNTRRSLLETSIFRGEKR